MMTINNWWGFRIRLPQGYDARPLNRPELMALFGNAAAWLQCGWLVWLILAVRQQTTKELIRHDIVTPLVLAGLAVAAALLIPPSWLENTWTGAKLVYARESGRMRSLDRLVLLAIAIALIVAVWKRPAHWQAMVILLGTVAVIEIVLGFVQERIVFDSRRATVQIPSWLTDIAPVIEDQGIVQPEIGAQKTYPFRVGDVLHHVGVRIEDALLTMLREINARFHGRLFHEEALAVILADREPVVRVGKDEVLRLSAQVAAIGKSASLTRYTLANAVLSFVQEQIRYARDDESTTTFTGGPFPEYGRFALETMNDGVGDCDCTAILTATLLAHIGFDTSLIFLSFHDAETDEICHHAAVGLSTEDLFLAAEQAFDAFTLAGRDGDHRRYLYGETAVDGTTLAFGTVPAEWKKTLDIYKVVPIPRCT